MKKVLCLILATVVAISGCGDDTTAPNAVLWQAWLESPGGALNFGLEISGSRAWIVNGDEKIEIVEFQLTAEEMSIGLPHYDSSNTATWNTSASRYDGVYRKRRGPDLYAEMNFHATDQPANKGGNECGTTAFSGQGSNHLWVRIVVPQLS